MSTFQELYEWALAAELPKEFEYKNTDINRAWRRAKGQTGTSEDRKVAILGDNMYIQRFKMPKWNGTVSVLDTPDVAIRYFNTLGIPTRKEAHRRRAETFGALKQKYTNEHHRLVKHAEEKYGTQGSLISGGLRDHWPSQVKDRIRFVAHGTSTLADAIQLHQALSKTRAHAFH